MANTVENLILDLIEWLAREQRSYRETMDAWRTSCPRLPVWEDATDRGFVATTFVSGSSRVIATQAGLDFLKVKRPERYDQLRLQTSGAATAEASREGASG